MSEERIRELIGRFASEDDIVRTAAWKELLDIGRPAIPLLIESLKNPDPLIRAGAARTLRSPDDMSVVDALIDALQDEDERVRRYAAWSLCYTKDKRAVEPLIAAYSNDEFFGGRAAAIHSLGHLRDESSFGTIQAALEDQHPYVRSHAVTAISVVKHPAWIDAVMAAFSDESYEVRMAAARTIELEAMSGEFVDSRFILPLINALSDEHHLARRSAIRALGIMHAKEAVEPLANLLESDPEASIRSGAASALGDIGDIRAIESLHKAQCDTEDRVQIAAGLALGRLGVEPNIDTALKALADDNWFIKSDAIFLLGHSKDQRAIDALLSILHDPDESTREYVLLALKATGDPRLEDDVISMLDDPDETVRSMAAHALSCIGGKKSVDVLIKRLGCQYEPDMRASAAWALWEMSSPCGLDALVNALENKDLAVVASVYHFFVQRGIPGSEETLIQALEVQGHKWMACCFTQSSNVILAEAGHKWIEEHPNEAEDLEMEQDEDYPLPKWGSNPA